MDIGVEQDAGLLHARFVSVSDTDLGAFSTAVVQEVTSACWVKVYSLPFALVVH